MKALLPCTRRLLCHRTVVGSRCEEFYKLLVQQMHLAPHAPLPPTPYQANFQSRSSVEPAQTKIRHSCSIQNQRPQSTRNVQRARHATSEHPACKHLAFNTQPTNQPTNTGIKRPNALKTHLLASEPAVLVKDGCQRPFLPAPPRSARLLPPALRHQPNTCPEEGNSAHPDGLYSHNTCNSTLTDQQQPAHNTNNSARTTPTPTRTTSVMGWEEPQGGGGSQPRKLCGACLWCSAQGSAALPSPAPRSRTLKFT